MRISFAGSGLAGLVVAILMIGMAGSAAAEEPHVRSGTIGETELSLTEQSSIAIDQRTGDAYVADTNHGRIAKYGPAGEVLGNLATVAEPTFLAVDNSSGDVYAVGAHNETITKFSSAGVPVALWGTAGSMGGFGKIAGIAVDASSNLFVLSEESDGEVYELNPEGSRIDQCTVPYVEAPAKHQLNHLLVAPNGLAVDSSGDLYINLLRESTYFGNVPYDIAKITSTCAGITSRFVPGAVPYAGLGVYEGDDSLFVSEGGEAFPSEGAQVIEHFSSDGTKLGSFGAGEGMTVGQLAVRSSNEAVYVVDTGHQDVAIFAPATVEPPDVIFEEPGGVTEVTGTSAHFEAEINPNGYETTYRFECIPNCPWGTSLGQQTLQASSELKLVEATAEKLRPGTDYKVYITAENPGGETRAPEEPDEGLPFTTGSIAPTIEEEAVTQVSETAATVTALINPSGAETEYWVQYVTSAQFEASEFAAARETPVGTLATSGEGTPVSVALTELAPSAPYVFRFVATNTVEGEHEETRGEPTPFATREPSLLPTPGSCPNEIFRTEWSATLPDCRAYEQSSPADKNGGGVEAIPGAVQATEDPDSVTFYNQAGVPGGVGAQDMPTFLSSRGDGSWSTEGLLPPQSLGPAAAYLGLSPGGRYAISDAVGLDPQGETLGTGLFRRDLRSGQMTTLVPYDAECGTIKCFVLAGASADGSRIFFESTLPLTGETPSGQRNVFLWEEDSGVSLVDVNEGGDPLPEGGFAGPYEWPEENLAGGGTREHLYVGAINAISRDGGQIAFTQAQENEGSAEGGQLYVRKGLGGPTPESVKVSAYHEGTSGPELPAAFLEANPDGRYIFFKSRAELTSNAYAGGTGQKSAILYRYDTSNGVLVDLTPDPAEEYEDGPGVEGMLGASESGNVAYFAATAALTSEEGPTGETAVAGEPNLYRWEEGASEPLSFVATLKGGSLVQTTPSLQGDTRDWSPAVLTSTQAPLSRAARVSSDGGSVVFSARRALTGAPNRSGACADGECAEFFRYAAASDTLDCISCDPTGARPLGDARIGAEFVNSGSFPSVEAAPVLPRNLSANGDRFFFETPNPLVAADINSRSGCALVHGTEIEQIPSCLDVYEWEAPGSGTCPQASATRPNGGCLFLISSGQSGQPSYFADADRQGGNAYFFTASPLVPADGDQNYDVYDARVEGGLASQHEMPAEPCGSRQVCQGPQAAAETAGTPGTSTFIGPGNPKAPKCRKGFVRRHGKCVKRHRHLKRHHRKHGHHGAKHHKKGKQRSSASATRRVGHERGGKK